MNGTKEKSDLERGGEALAKEAARKQAGRDRSDETAADFDEGWRAGREASDPENETTAQDVRDRVRGEYEDKTEEEREAYRAGYASGSDR